MLERELQIDFLSITKSRFGRLNSHFSPGAAQPWWAAPVPVIVHTSRAIQTRNQAGTAGNVWLLVLSTPGVVLLLGNLIVVLLLV